ncbi:MAG: alpha-L-fucosidase [Kiritimatiellae bacterium]|nr:alpha-L-fucosidase [Kiritimatiellia bacterium]
MFKSVLAAAVISGSALAYGVSPDELPKSIFNETEERRAERLAWWRHDRFGMFIHFGLYSMPARHEWVRNREYIPNEIYDKKYFPRFNPDLFDAREWARAAKKAGMKYMVLTTKHHEGFCMWDSKVTDYKITNTPFKRDLVKEYVEACRAEGLKVGFYYSIIDWHHPDFTIDVTHPLRPKEGFTDESYAKLNEGRDMAKYREYMFAQVRELLTWYGKIDIIWFDYTSKEPKYGKSWKDWNAVELVKMARSINPDIMIDNRLDLMDTDDGWDFVTPEQFKVQTWPTIRGKRVPWETCQTFSGSWGYYRDEATWKSVPQLVELLSHTVSFGGNLILNVGPTARGEFDNRAMERLEGLGKWMRYNSRSIYGCTEPPAGFTAPNGTALTYNPRTNALYIHLYDYPMGYLPIEFFDKVEYAQFLHDGSEIFLMAPLKRHSQSGDQTKFFGGLVLPVLKPDVSVPVIELFLKK